MKNCWSCGNETEDDKKFCDNCGVQLTPKTCLSCNQENNPESQFCTSCGCKFDTGNSRKLEPKLNTSSSKLFKSLSAIFGLIIILSIIYISYQYISKSNVFSAQNENIATNNIENNQINNETTKSSNEPHQNLNHNYEIGGVIEFGTYYQNDFINKTPIIWRILDIQNGKALLISELLLDAQPYNKEFKKITWENSSIRHWLNNYFINAAFSKSEQSKINLTFVNNVLTSTNGRYGGNNTQDKIFLLSLDEVKKYLPNENQRAIKVTQYAIKQGAWVCKKSNFCIIENNGVWWLRSPDNFQDRAADVRSGGHIDVGGDFVNFNYNAVRPALIINL